MYLRDKVRDFLNVVNNTVTLFDDLLIIFFINGVYIITNYKIMWLKWLKIASEHTESV